MRLTTKGRYAVTAMLDVALHRQHWPVRLADIAARQHIPPSYLEQLSSRLRQQGLLTSIRGPKGGYQLGRSATDITLADILLAAEEAVDVTRCGGTSDCQNGTVCLTHAVWAELNKEIWTFFERITLETLCQKTEIRNIAARQDTLFQSCLEEVL